jgi:hypothetical protein
MILTPRCYTRDWLLEQAARTGTQDVVLEKCVHALTLVAALSEEGLDFVFKGGTSLMLHLNPVRRLAAFAPTTIGVLYQPYSKKTGEPTEPRPIRVMKQLFDVGELFSAATDLEAIVASYRQHFEEQNTFRGGKFTLEDALEDTLGAAYSLCQIDLKPQIDDGNRAFFKAGVDALNTHLIRSRLSLYEAKTAAARAALLASHIKSGNTGKSLAGMRAVPSDVNVLKSLRIDGRWKKLHISFPTHHPSNPCLTPSLNPLANFSSIPARTDG